MRWFGALLPFVAVACVTTDAPRSPWAQDAGALFSEMAAQHPGLYRHTSRKDFARYLTAYRQNPGTDDQQAVARLAELVARAGDGHTLLPLLSLPFEGVPEGPRQRLLPLRFEWFDDGLFVVGADARYRNLVGARVEGLGAVSADTALARAMRLLPHATPRFAAEYAPEWLLGEIALRFTGAITGRDVRSLTLTTDRGRAEIALVGPPLSFDWLKTRAGGFTADWVSERADDTPRLWSMAPASDSAIQWRITELRDRGDMSLSAAAADLGSKRLILDLRDCIGGDGSLIPAMLGPLANAGEIVALIGRRTHSACVMLVSALEQRGGVRFVGQATGDAPNHYGETNVFVLPNARIPVVHASRWWQTSSPGDRRPWREPDVAIPFLHSDYAAGRDPALDKAMTL